MSSHDDDVKNVGNLNVQGGDTWQSYMWSLNSVSEVVTSYMNICWQNLFNFAKFSLLFFFIFARWLQHQLDLLVVFLD